MSVWEFWQVAKRLFMRTMGPDVSVENTVNLV